MRIQTCQSLITACYKGFSDIITVTSAFGMHLHSEIRYRKICIKVVILTIMKVVNNKEIQR